MNFIFSKTLQVKFLILKQTFKILKLNIKKTFFNPMIINMVIIGSVSLVSSIIGFFKEVLIGSTYGLSEFLDTFTLAILIPSFIQNVFIGAVKNIFIPNYIAEEKSTKKIQEFQLLVLGIITLIIIVFFLIIFFFNSYLIQTLFKNHTESYYNLIKLQLYIILPSLFFWGYSGFLGSLLEISKKFLFVSISPIFVSVVTIFNIYFLKDVLGDKVLAVSILIGSILNFLYLLMGSYYYKVIKIKKIVRFSFNKNMNMMLNQIPAKTISGLLTGINPLVDQMFAVQLVTGSIIALSYGNRIPQFGVSIAVVSIGTVLLPHFSSLINEDIQKAYKELFKILKVVFISSLVISLFLVFFSDNIIYYTFEHGEFDKNDTKIVGSLQQIYFLQVPFFICTIILVKFLTSINKNNFMALVSFLNLIINLLLNYIFVEKYEVYGLALSTTCVIIISSMVYFIYTRKHYKLIK